MNRESFRFVKDDTAQSHPCGICGHTGGDWWAVERVENVEQGEAQAFHLDCLVSLAVKRGLSAYQVYRTLVLSWRGFPPTIEETMQREFDYNRDAGEALRKSMENITRIREQEMAAHFRQMGDSLSDKLFRDLIEKWRKENPGHFPFVWPQV